MTKRATVQEAIDFIEQNMDLAGVVISDDRTVLLEWDYFNPNEPLLVQKRPATADDLDALKLIDSLYELKRTV